LILPLGLNQAYKSSYFQEKSKFLAPYLQPLQDKLKNAVTQEEKLAAQQALMKAQKENGLDMMSSMGCLPLLIQMPFFSALFYAARYTPGVSDATFLGMNLGQSSIVLTIIAGIFYFIQSYISMIGVDEAQRGQMKTMLFMSPAMIVFFSLTSPAGVTLYWVVGGLFGIIQQVITTFIIKPRLKKRIDEEFEKNPPVINAGMKDVTPTAAGTVKSANVDPAILAAARKKQNRNAGKQKRK
jgi:YidC/Oxa1 family membrane protein insertase